MLTRLFRAHSNMQLMIVIIGALLLWSDAFYHRPLPLQGHELAPLYTWLFSWTFSSGILANIIAFVILLGTAILWNYILVNHGLLPRNTFMPVIITVLLMSYAPQLLRLSPVLPANLLLVISMHLLLKSGPRDKAYQDLFSAGILLSLAAFINVYHVFFIPLIWISLMLYRSYTLREWFISLLGILTPVIYLAFYFFWNDQFMLQLLKYADFFRHFRFLFAMGDLPFMIVLIILVITLFILVAFFRFVGRLNERLISLRKSSMVIVWLFLLGLLSIPALQTEWLVNGSVMLLAASLFISHYILSVKKKTFAELMLWLMLAAIVAGKFLL